MKICIRSFAYRNQQIPGASGPAPDERCGAGNQAGRLLCDIACLCLGLIICICVLAEPLTGQPVQDGQALFEEKCAPCHSIGEGDILGPDLDGVVSKRDRAWLGRWIRFPEQMVREEDPLAVQLLKAWNDMPMPDTGLSEADADAVIAYIEARSEDSSSDLAAQGSRSATVPVPMGDPAEGEMLFTGEKKFQNMGTPCIACHSVAGIGVLGGGNMGPDLTNAYGRLGEAGLAAALKALPFATMRPLYDGRLLTAEEQGHMHAFFARVDERDPEAGPSANLWIWCMGAAGVLVLFGVMAVFRPA